MFELSGHENKKITIGDMNLMFIQTSSNEHTD